MITVEVGYYIRILLLLTRVALPAMRDYVNENLGSGSVHDFLKKKKSKIDDLKTEVNSFQWHQLNEGCKTEVDISKWDISSLSCIPLYLFDKLDPCYKRAIEFIKTTKNNIQSHTSSGSITVKVMEQKYKELTRQINNLCSGPEFSQPYRLELQEKFRKVDEDELDISSIKAELRSKFTNDVRFDNVFRIIEGLERNTERWIDNSRADIIQVVNDGFGDLKDKLKSYVSNGINNNTVTVLVGKLPVTGNNPAKVAKTAAKLAEETNACIHDSSEACKPDPLHDDIKKLIALLESCGAKVKEARNGSVLLEIECPTVQAVLDVWDCFESQEMQYHLNQIASYLSHEVDEDIKISAIIPQESIAKVLRLIEEVYRAEVEIVMQCHSIDEALQTLHIFEDGSVEQINKIAKDLSNEVGASVSLSAFLDRIEFHREKTENLSAVPKVTEQSGAKVKFQRQKGKEVRKRKQQTAERGCKSPVDVDELQNTKMSQNLDPKMDPSNPDKLTTIWVGNVTDDIAREYVLLPAFSRYGFVKSIRSLPHKHCAFVNYTDHRAAGRAMKYMQGERLGKNPLLIRFPDKPIDNSKQWGFAYIRPRTEHFMKTEASLKTTMPEITRMDTELSSKTTMTEITRIDTELSEETVLAAIELRDPES